MKCTKKEELDMINNNINNVYDKSYKDLLSNKETFLSLIQNFVNDSWGSRITEEIF
jgi:hypothetical protein